MGESGEALLSGRDVVLRNERVYNEEEEDDEIVEEEDKGEE